MIWSKFLTYGYDSNAAFETLCNQLFENYLIRTEKENLLKFRVVNGAAGDGGVEAYGLLGDGKIIAVQAKWFRDSLGKDQFKQIKKSIDTALTLRPQIVNYIICIPRDIASVKFGRGAKGEQKKPIANHEDSFVDDFNNEIKSLYPTLSLTWWFDHDINSQLLQPGNEGIRKFWFDRELISLQELRKLFDMAKIGWLHQRYIPELHAQGVIHDAVEEIKFSQSFRNPLQSQLLLQKRQLQNTVKIIEEFINSGLSNDTTEHHLNLFLNNIELECDNLKNVIDALKIGNDQFVPEIIPDFNRTILLAELENMKPRNGQYNTLLNLENSLDYYAQFKKQKLCAMFPGAVRLILGEPGTGKTHGLANAVDQHIEQSTPAIIIQAKNANNKGWTELLSSALSLLGWSSNEILGALQALAIASDHQKAKQLKKGEELSMENSKVLICIDGVEEDIGKEKLWYTRIRESVLLSKEFPRIRFVFSGRNYFHKSSQDPTDYSFAAVLLPQEGDVPVWSVAQKYFSKNNFNIKIGNLNRIRGIDSLFALRLFCDKYEGQTLNDDELILTTTYDLLQSKINMMEEVFSETSISRISGGVTPILDTLLSLSDYFFIDKKIPHERASAIVKETVGNYIPNHDEILDFLVNNGLLIRQQDIQRIHGLEKRVFSYTMINNSTIELIIASRLADEISSGKIEDIPNIYLIEDSKGNTAANLVLQTAIDRIFLLHNKLAGDEGFALKGFDKDSVLEMRLKALTHSSREQFNKYADEIKMMVLSGGHRQAYALQYLILPSSRYNQNFFGGIFLHEILYELDNVFSRDQIWSGLDENEKRSSAKNQKIVNPIKFALLNFLDSELALSPYALFDETPLILAWSLSNLDQGFREKARNSLAVWALQQPTEFKKLLDLIFKNNDPQIQADLSSVMIALAANLKDLEAIQELAKWSLQNVFSQKQQYRNVLIRQGMRAIVERGYQFRLITSEEVEICRPKLIEEKELLLLDRDAMDGGEEFYPIVHDLAWYVLKKSFENFLEYPSSRGENELIDNDSKSAKALMELYRQRENDKEIFAYTWAMGAAISYIKSLGFNRTKGNGFTESSHGSKSRLFTCEEKYTWLAVYYLQGYLADYVSFNDFGAERLVTDYSILTAIPNPAESKIFQKAIVQEDYFPNWIIKGKLVGEIENDEDVESFIKSTINNEPNLDFNEWINYKLSDFYNSADESDFVALYNSTTVHDSNEYVLAKISVTAGIIKKDVNNSISDPRKQISCADNLKDLHARPDTDIYSNPSNLMWMDWIEETECDQEFIFANDYQCQILSCVTSVTSETVDGEEYNEIPSKEVRKRLGITNFIGQKFLNTEGRTVGFLHKKRDERYNSQEILVVEKETLFETLERDNLELVWFIEYFQRTNNSNPRANQTAFTQKTRKYFIKQRDGLFHFIKFWDAIFSNRDN